MAIYIKIKDNLKSAFTRSRFFFGFFSQERKVIIITKNIISLFLEKCYFSLTAYKLSY